MNTMDEIEKGIDETIRKAMREGYFKNLPGAGKPLRLDSNPHENPDWSLAFHLLKENDFTLPWLAERNEIEKDLEAAKNKLQTDWEWAKVHSEQQGEWLNAQEKFRQRVTEINKRIQNYNLSVPSSGFQRLSVNADREIKRLTSDI